MPYGAAEYTRPPGLLSLTLPWTLSPLVALVNQELIYQANMWACGHDTWGTIHIVPALCVIVTVGCIVAAYINWQHVGKGVEVEHEGVVARTRFLAIGGIVISFFSTLVILGQWLGVFFFDPCMRA